MSVRWQDLRVPVMAAPMFIVSNLDLVIAACRAGVIGAFPSANPRAPETLDDWLGAIRAAERESIDRGEPFAPFCVNLLASSAVDKNKRDRALATVAKHEAPLILTNMGDPKEVVDAAHGWGGTVFHDVTTIRHAEKAIEAGVDGSCWCVQEQVGTRVHCRRSLSYRRCVASSTDPSCWPVVSPTDTESPQHSRSGPTSW